MISTANPHLNKLDRKLLVVVAILVTVLFSPVVFASGGIRVVLKSEVAVDRETIRLADIADLRDVPSDQREAIAAIDVARSPQPGQTRFVSSDYIRIRLRRAGVDTDAIRFQGPEDVRITRRANTLPIKHIRKAVETTIKRQMPWQPEDVTVSGIRFDEKIQLPNGKLTYKIVPNRGEDYLGKTIFNLHFYVDGQLVRKVWAHATISVMADVVTLVRPIGKHQHIEIDDLAVKRHDLAKLPSDTIHRIEDALGNRALRKIYPDTVLRSSMISMPPIVKRGDVVKIVASTGAMTITATGLVKEQGRKGELVRVVNTDSKRIVTARVTGPGSVEVDF